VLVSEAPSNVSEDSETLQIQRGMLMGTKYLLYQPPITAVGTVAVAAAVVVVVSSHARQLKDG
jgi:hypothetical protein